jgi:hypothetical protein
MELGKQIGLEQYYGVMSIEEYKLMESLRFSPTVPERYLRQRPTLIETEVTIQEIARLRSSTRIKQFLEQFGLWDDFQDSRKKGIDLQNFISTLPKETVERTITEIEPGLARVKAEQANLFYVTGSNIDQVPNVAMVTHAFEAVFRQWYGKTNTHSHYVQTSLNGQLVVNTMSDLLQESDSRRFPPALERVHEEIATSSESDNFVCVCLPTHARYRGTLHELDQKLVELLHQKNLNHLFVSMVYSNPETADEEIAKMNYYFSTRDKALPWDKLDIRRVGQLRETQHYLNYLFND